MNQEKNDEMNFSAEDKKHFDNLESEIKKARIGEGGATAKLDVGDLCKQYHKIEPALKKALPFIKWIPKYGKTIATALEFLMGIADSACPVDQNN